MNPSEIDTQVMKNKELRFDIDRQLQNLKLLPPSRERAIAITKIQEAIMWIGMDLKRLNDLRTAPEPGPYPTSYDPTSSKVEPVADGLKL